MFFLLSSSCFFFFISGMEPSGSMGSLLIFVSRAVLCSGTRTLNFIITKTVQSYVTSNIDYGRMEGPISTLNFLTFCSLSLLMYDRCYHRVLLLDIDHGRPWYYWAIAVAAETDNWWPFSWSIDVVKKDTYTLISTTISKDTKRTNVDSSWVFLVQASIDSLIQKPQRWGIVRVYDKCSNTKIPNDKKPKKQKSQITKNPTTKIPTYKNLKVQKTQIQKTQNTKISNPKNSKHKNLKYKKLKTQKLETLGC